MATKITLNGLRGLVKQIVKGEFIGKGKIYKIYKTKRTISPPESKEVKFFQFDMNGNFYKSSDGFVDSTYPKISEKELLSDDYYTIINKY